MAELSTEHCPPVYTDDMSIAKRLSSKLQKDTLRTLLHSEKEARQKHVATLEERLGRLETAMGDTHSKHSLEIEATKAAHQRLSKEQKLRDDKHASIAERLEYLEAKIGDSFDQHERELKAAHSKLEQVHTRLSQCEKHGANISELHRSHSTSSQEHKAALAAHSASLGERLDFLEKSLGQSAEKHAKEVDALKASHSRITTETKLRDAHHATVSERLEYIEKMIGDSADKHAKELSAAHEKIQDMHKRVADCEAVNFRGTCSRDGRICTFLHEIACRRAEAMWRPFARRMIRWQTIRHGACMTGLRSYSTVAQKASTT